MTDIVTRLRNNFAIADYPMLKDHCHCCAIPKDWGGHHDNCLYDQAADEIERLRADVKRWSNWAIDYACDDMKCECDRCLAVRTAWEATVNGNR